MSHAKQDVSRKIKTGTTSPYTVFTQLSVFDPFVCRLFQDFFSFLKKRCNFALSLPTP